MHTFHVQMEAGQYMGIWDMEFEPRSGDVVVDHEGNSWKLLFKTIHINKMRYPRLTVRKHFG